MILIRPLFKSGRDLFDKVYEVWPCADYQARFDMLNFDLNFSQIYAPTCLSNYVLDNDFSPDWLFIILF